MLELAGELTRELMAEEGLRLTVYDDATGLSIHPGSLLKGHPTIGIGRALDVRGITLAEAVILVGNDIQNTQDQLSARIPWFKDLDENRQMVLMNMGFNLGVAGLLEFSLTLHLVQTGEYQAAATAMLNSAWARQVGGRAKVLAAQMTTGVRA